MTKQELIRRVARSPAFCDHAGPGRKKAVEALVDAVFAELATYFIEARISRRPAARARARTPRFTYPGFGTFTKKRRGARAGRHPQTGAAIAIPETVTLAFQPGSELKASLNRESPRRRSGQATIK
jgi:nucleoid DNA-binding protein